MLYNTTASTAFHRRFTKNTVTAAEIWLAFSVGVRCWFIYLFLHAFLGDCWQLKCNLAAIPLINNYSPKAKLILLNNYSTILTEPEVNNCFSIFTRSDLNRIRKETIKKRLVWLTGENAFLGDCWQLKCNLPAILLKANIPCRTSCGLAVPVHKRKI